MKAEAGVAGRPYAGARREDIRAFRSSWRRREQVEYRPQGQLATLDSPGLFGVPINVWLRGPLRDWAEGLLAERRLAAEGFLDAAMVRRAWIDHIGGRANNQYPLWNVLMFQAWRERWG